MKTSDIQKFKVFLDEYIEQLTFDSDIQTISNTLSDIPNGVDISQVYQDHINDFTDRYNNLSIDFNMIKQDMLRLSSDIIETVDHHGAEININNKEHLYAKFINGEPVEMFVSPEINHMVKSSIHKYVDWHYPVLQFGCRFNNLLPRKPRESYQSLGERLNDPDLFMEFEDSMTGGEPFYVCDFNQDSMNRCIEKFNPTFQSKICDYLIENMDFSKLPQEQFGLVFSWNLFNYATPDILKEYLEQIIKLVRPGGIIIFNYNNCDLPASIMMSEIGRESYMPKRHLTQIVSSLGLELINSHDMNNQADQIFPYSMMSWAELKKPGVLSTCKAHSSLGKISIKI